MILKIIIAAEETSTSRKKKITHKYKYVFEIILK
jgi:hypothetical protein